MNNNRSHLTSLPSTTSPTSTLHAEAESIAEDFAARLWRSQEDKTDFSGFDAHTTRDAAVTEAFRSVTAQLEDIRNARLDEAGLALLLNNLALSFTARGEAFTDAGDTERGDAYSGIGTEVYSRTFAHRDPSALLARRRSRIRQLHLAG